MSVSFFLVDDVCSCNEVCNVVRCSLKSVTIVGDELLIDLYEDIYLVGVLLRVTVRMINEATPGVSPTLGPAEADAFPIEGLG